MLSCSISRIWPASPKLFYTSIVINHVFLVIGVDDGVGDRGRMMSGVLAASSLSRTNSSRSYSAAPSSERRNAFCPPRVSFSVASALLSLARSSFSLARCYLGWSSYESHGNVIGNFRDKGVTIRPSGVSLSRQFVSIILRCGEELVGLIFLVQARRI